MKTLLQSLQNTLLTGFFVLLPLLLFGILLDEMLGAVVGLATPIADLFPEGTFEQMPAPVAVATLLIVLASFLLGLAAKPIVAQRFGHWLESNTLGRLPLYRAVKSLTSRFAAMEESGKFRPALVRGTGDQREFAFFMEDLGDGFATVMLPRVPTAMVGSIKVVPVAMIELLDVSLGEFTAAISHWGIGSKELMSKASLQGPKPPSI